MNRFIKVSTEAFTPEGMEVSKWDHDLASKEHVQPCETWLSVDNVESVREGIADPKKCVVNMVSGEEYIVLMPAIAFLGQLQTIIQYNQ